MLVPLLGYFFCMITVLAAAVVLLTGVSNISTLGNGRHHSPVISRTVTVELQRRSPVAKEASPAKEELQRHSPVAKEASPAKEELQRHSPVAKEASPAKDVSPVVATAKADTKKTKHYKPKVLARHPNNNHGYGNALGYAEESRYGPRGPFFQ
jgi:hypothetical protein